MIYVLLHVSLWCSLMLYCEHTKWSIGNEKMLLFDKTFNWSFSCLLLLHTNVPYCHNKWTYLKKIGQIGIGNVPTAMLFDYIKVIGLCYQVKQNSICIAARWYISIQNLSYLPGMHVWIHWVTDSNCSKSARLRLSAHGQCACLRCQHLWYVGWGVQKFSVAILGLYSLRRRRRVSIGIPIINLRPSSDRLRFIMGIPIPVRRHFF